MSRARELARSLRQGDRFHAAQPASALMEGFFPEGPRALAADLSNVTSMFYGLALQVVREWQGDAAMDAMSREVFYRLGRAKSRATRDAQDTAHLFHGDARDIVTVLVSAIYNASPEYEFDVVQYGPERCAVELRGADRYYRAARLLGIADGLTWPTLHPFFEGVSDELGLHCQVRSHATPVDGGAGLHASYVFDRRAIEPA